VYQGYDVTLTHKTFALKTAITHEMVEDDQFRQVDARAKGLAIAKNRSVEKSGADVLNYGFTAGGGGNAQFQTGQDGVALFSTAHTRTDGGANQSNYTTADLAEDSLETALVAMRATVDDRGQLILVRPDTLIIPPALEKEARIILDSSLRTGTANNDINPYQGRLKIVVWDFLGAANAGGSDTAWFIADSKSHKLNWFWREQGSLERQVDFDTKNIEYSILTRWSNGYADWRNIYGSKGDNS
jgi:hypothetical protein